VKIKFLFYGELRPRITGISYMNEVFLKNIENIYEDNILITIISKKSKNSLFSKFYNRLSELFKITYHFNNSNYFFLVFDFNLISIFNLYYFKILSLLFNRNILIHVQIHRVDFHNLNFKNLIFFIFKKINIIVLNQYQFDYLKKSNITSIIFPNTLSQEIEFEKQTDNKFIKFTYLSNYIRSKGILLLLNSFSRILNNNIILNTYGSYLDNEIKENDLKKFESDNIYIHEAANEDQKKIIFSNTDCIILPSLDTEAQSILVIEAMYYGIPIIVSNVGTISDMLGENYDLLVNDINEINLKAIINKFLNYNYNDLKKISTYLKSRYYLKYSQKIYIENLKKIFNIKKTVLLYSSFSNFTTGQSIISNNALNLLSMRNHVLIIDTTRYKSRFLNFLNSFFYSINFKLFYSYSFIYITASRSKYGFLKDYLNIFILKNKYIFIYNHIHGINFIKNNNSYISKYLLKNFFNITINILLHDSLKKEYREFQNFKYFIIENYFDPKFNILSKKEFNIKKTIFYPSNIMYSKGIFIYLEVAEFLLNYNHSLHFVISGDFYGDNFYNKFEIKTEFFRIFNKLKSKFPNNISYIGKINLDKKISIYNKSDIVLMPTFYEIEAFPLVALESFASKCIVITHDFNYLKDVFSKYILFYTNNTPQEYINCINNILQDPQKIIEIVDSNHNLVKKYNNIDSFNKKFNHYIV
jgi:glycosyltransferase involved in cell wall biosynthesis